MSAGLPVDQTQAQAKVVKDPRPVAPLAELHNRRLDPETYGACGAPVIKNEKLVVIGCRHHETCPFAFKHTPSNTLPLKEQGPRNGGVRIVSIPSVGGSMREVQMTCHGYLDRKPQHELRGGFMDWIAEQGEEITTKGSERVDPARPELGYKDVIRNEVVNAHPHIDGDIGKVNAAYEAQIRARHAAERRRRYEESVMGQSDQTGERIDVHPTGTTEQATHEPGRPKRR